MRLLIVEDEPDQLSALAQLFREEQFSVDTAADGNVGLLLGSANRYDLIILDWMLPGLDGRALLGELRKMINTPVLLLTARDAVDDRVAGLRGGADDYLTKPFSLVELLARVHALLRRNAQSSAYERVDEPPRNSQTARAASTLDSARQVQQRLTPAAFPQTPGVDIAFDYRPVQWVSGDYCDVWRAREGRLAFVIGDVSGKGVHAAMVMAAVHAAVRASSDFHDGPADIVKYVNDHLSRHLPGGMFVTLFLGMLDLSSGLCQYVNAGHMPPMLVDAQGRVSRFSSPGSLMLGIAPAAPVLAEQQLSPGDCIVAVTDGVTEALCPSGEQFGMARLQTTLTGTGGDDASSCVQHVTRAVSDFQSGRPPNDDLTVLALRWLGNSSSSSEA